MAPIIAEKAPLILAIDERTTRRVCLVLDDKLRVHGRGNGAIFVRRFAELLSGLEPTP